MIQDFQNLFAPKADRPWLIAGAGAATTSAAANDGFVVLALPDAAALIESEVAVLVDIETVHTGGDAIASKAKNVLMPREPHQDGWATGKTLDQYVDELPILRKLESEGRLFVFDLWTGSRPAPAAIEGDYKGEEVPLRLLIASGIKIARHSGARLAKPASSGFESAPPIGKRQVGSGLAELRRTSGISYGPYGFPVPARIFVGSDDEQMMGVRVLQYSIEKFSTMDISVEALDWRTMPVPKDERNRSKTGFSFCRFDIPRLCGYSGRGMYADADMLVFADITDVWTLPMKDADLLYALTHPSQGRTPQTSVMLLNCEALKWDVHDIIRGLDEERYTYKQLMSDLCIVPQGRAKPDLPYWWNSLEIYEPGRTSLIHYTDMVTQPWVSHANKNGKIWYACCAEAIATGFIKPDEVQNAVKSGHISPDIYDWIGHPSPENYQEAGAVWVAPFNRFSKVVKPEGAVRITKDNRFVGWAWDPAKPNEPIDVGIYDGDDLVLTIHADIFGEFLARYGKGNGRHAFNAEAPQQLLKSNADFYRAEVLGARKIELKGSPIKIFR